MAIAIQLLLLLLQYINRGLRPIESSLNSITVLPVLAPNSISTVVMGGPQALKFFNLQRIQRVYMLILLAPGLPAGPEQLIELI